VVNFVSPYWLINALSQYLLVQQLMALSEFSYYKLLQLNYIHHIQKTLDLFNNENAELTGNGAVAEFSEYEEQSAE
jgi:hypothetical protein